MTSGSTLFDVVCAQAGDNSDRLVDGTLWVADFEPVTVGTQIDWTLDPFAQPQWRHRLHSLDFVWPDLRIGRVSQVERIVRDWLDHNPRHDPPSDHSWAHHTTAKRTRVMAATYLKTPSERLKRGLRDHAAVLADKAFYAGHHNHGISQDMSLMLAGTVLGEADLVNLARSRAAENAKTKVDAEGMVDEQATAYQGYVLQLYRQFAQLADACGQPFDAAMHDLVSMERALADLLMPDGSLAPIGDTYWSEAPDFWLPAVPDETSIRVYRAGYVVGRSKGGSAFFVLRFGPGRAVHGHDDHMSLILHTHGLPRLVEGGHVGYEHSEFRRHLRGPGAHNVVLSAAEEAFDRNASTELQRESDDSFTLRDSPYDGVTRERRCQVTLDPVRVVVRDRIRSSGYRRWRQLWHLPPTASVEVDPPRASVVFTDGRRMLFTQARPLSKIEVVAGCEDPFVGWMALRHRRVPTPVIVSESEGTDVEFYTTLEMD